MMKKRIMKKSLKKSMWYELFGTPERAALTLWEKEVACTSTHVGVACFGLDECGICPFRYGLCGQGKVLSSVEPLCFDDLLDMLENPRGVR